MSKMKEIFKKLTRNVIIVEDNGDSSSSSEYVDDDQNPMPKKNVKKVKKVMKFKNEIKEVKVDEKKEMEIFLDSVLDEIDGLRKLDEGYPELDITIPDVKLPIFAQIKNTDIFICLTSFYKNSNEEYDIKGCLLSITSFPSKLFDICNRMTHLWCSRFYNFKETYHLRFNSFKELELKILQYTTNYTKSNIKNDLLIVKRSKYWISFGNIFKKQLNLTILEDDDEYFSTNIESETFELKYFREILLKLVLI